MAKAASPPHYSRDHFYDPTYTAEITAKMQVPKRIKVAGGNEDDEDEVGPSIPWQPEKIDMRVPDRILVAGQDRHIGTPAPPRELIIENTIMPPDPGVIRVQTPPRVITLDEHYFPSVAEEYYEKENDTPNEVNVYNEINSYKNADNTQSNFALDQSMNARDFSTTIWNNGPFLKTEEEIVHLRKQLVKVNRRVVNIEREIASKANRDKLIFGMATAYFIIKILMWMNKN